MVSVQRVYDDPEGFCILIDRLWPRGISKERIGHWCKDVAPSTNLRKQFHSKELSYDEFARLYDRELANNPALEDLRAVLDIHDDAVLVTAAQLTNSHVPSLLRALTAL